MDVELLRLIYDYSIKGKLIDKAYLDKFIEIVVRHKELNHYVRKSKIMETGSETESEFQVATYTPFTKTIIVYENAINALLEKVERKEHLFTDIEKVFYKNIVISQTILHELEHANQEKMKEEEDSIESLILRASGVGIKGIDSEFDIFTLNTSYVDYCLNLLKQREKNYRDNYLYAPFERLAEIKSFSEIIEILKNIKEYIPNVLEYENYLLGKNMIRGFNDELFSPTIYYIQNNLSDYSFMTWYNENDLETSLAMCKSEYDLSKRLRYGLMIDSYEYTSIKENLDSTRFN